MVREAERDECVGAGQSELRVPQDRQGRFRTELCERCPRGEQARVAALAAMYVQGVSTRQVKAITEELCGHQFSSATISRAIQAREEELARLAQRESATSGKEFLQGRVARGWHGVEDVTQRRPQRAQSGRRRRPD